MSMTHPDGKFRRGVNPRPRSALFLLCHKWRDYFSDGVKRLLILMVSIFLLPACLSMTHYDHQKTPREIVYIFMSTYGTPGISQLAHYTTPFFRNYKPEELWVIETWEVLSELGYRHVKGTILEERIKGDSALIVTSSSIETVAGETLQRETYCFIKTSEGWKLDDLLVEEETVEAEKFSL
jgi:hypothetical protein